MTTYGNPAFVTIYELTPSEGAMLRMRNRQFPPQLRYGMNPELMCNIIPLASQTSQSESQYWGEVCRVSAQQHKTRVPLPRPTPPKSLERAFIRYANAMSKEKKRTMTTD
jgi:hypothetical protein